MSDVEGCLIFGSSHREFFYSKSIGFLRESETRIDQIADAREWSIRKINLNTGAASRWSEWITWGTLRIALESIEKLSANLIL
jgi:hypothetical protein